MKLQIVYLISGEIVGYQVGASGAWEGLINWIKKWLIDFFKFCKHFFKTAPLTPNFGRFAFKFLPLQPKFDMGTRSGFGGNWWGQRPPSLPKLFTLVSGDVRDSQGQGYNRLCPDPQLRPSTRCNGVWNPRGGWVELQDFGPGGGWVARFWARAARNLASGAEGAGFENFWHFRKKIVS